MKTFHYILLVFCVQTSVCAQNIVFADINFKNRLLNAGNGNQDASTVWDNSNPLDPHSITSVFVDTNHDGEIQVNEALNITSLNLSNANINDLSGIEYFTNLKALSISPSNDSGYGISTLNATGLQNLEFLGISSPNITSFGFLSNFPNLKILSFNDIIGNPTDFNWTNSIIRIRYGIGYLDNINLSHLPNLIYLDCSINNLSFLDTSNNPNLQRVDCSKNHITTLDFRNNPLLNDLACRNNPNLTSIYVKNGATQVFGANAPVPSVSLYFNWENCPNLNYVCADANEITSIQNILAPNYNLANITFSSDCALATENFEKEAFTVYPNPTNGIFNLKFNTEKFKTTEIVIFNTIGQLVYENNILISNEFSVDISNLPAGHYFMKVKNGEELYNHKIIKN